jgi:hypothetical protein
VRGGVVLGDGARGLKTPRGRTVNGEYKLNMNLIYDPALLKELIEYNRDGNFDRVMALMIGMYYLKEVEYRNRPVKSSKHDEKEGFFNTLNLHNFFN